MSIALMDPDDMMEAKRNAAAEGIDRCSETLEKLAFTCEQSDTLSKGIKRASM